MIYTLTLSPCLDYVLEVNNFNKGIINKSNNEYIYPGGKGINVSIVLNQLNVNSLALGFVGETVGSLFEEKLKENNINFDFIKTNVDTRINVKISSSEETAIDSSSKPIGDNYISKLINKLRLTLKDFDILLFCVDSLLQDVFSQGRFVAYLEEDGLYG